MSDTPPLSFGASTRWGKVISVASIGGERYYFVVNTQNGAVAMMPADVVEEPRRGD